MIPDFFHPIANNSNNPFKKLFFRQDSNNPFNKKYVFYSRETNIGIKLEVNDKILNSCNELMGAVRELVIKSKEVQEEIVSNGRGQATPIEFYKRNHLWTEGFFFKFFEKRIFSKA